LRGKHHRAYSWQLIYGDGTNDEQLNGLMEETGAATLAWSDTSSKENNRLDALMETADLIYTGGTVSFVMNKNTWRTIISEKDGNSRYLHARDGSAYEVVVGQGMRSIGEHPIILDNTVVKDYVLAVDLSSASELYLHPDAGQLSLGYVSDDFEKNILRFRYEEMAVHAVLSQQAYAMSYLDNAPT
jgi:HK97 family phage major capsid protein